MQNSINEFQGVIVVVVQMHITAHCIIQCIQVYITEGDVGNESTTRELWSSPHLMPIDETSRKKCIPMSYNINAPNQK